MKKPIPAEEWASEALQTVAALAKALGDENRLRVLLSVAAGKKPVSAIVAEVKLSQPLVSHHLKELRRVLLVRVERSGPFVFYELSDLRLPSLLATLRGIGDDLIRNRTTLR